MPTRAATSIPGLCERVRAKSQPHPDLRSPDDFAPAFDVFADARPVLLGEAARGTAEFRAEAAPPKGVPETYPFDL